MDKNLIITTISLSELKELIQESIQEALQPLSKKETPHEQKYLTVEQVAKYLRIAKQTVYGYTSSRSIPFIKKGKKLLFLQADLDTWLTESKKKTRDQLAKEI